MTFVACPGVGVAPQVGAARRIGTDGPTVILMDADGTPRRSLPPRVGQ
jgi:hypothetical protein